MLYRQNIDFCFPGKSHKKNFATFVAEAKVFIERLKKEKLELLNVPYKKEDVSLIEKTAGHIRKNFKTLVVLGTGGSSLSGQALVALRKRENKLTKIIFTDNIDPHSFDLLFLNINIKETFFLVISKSGGTLETLSQFVICLQEAEKKIGDAFNKNFLAITDAASSPLRRMAEELSIKIINHDKVGGRFSGLTSVGLLPAAVAGLDIEKIRNGAAEVINDANRNNEPEVARGAALNIMFTREKINSIVLMPYVDRLEKFAVWFRQIWSESLGKEGYGTTPLVSMGTIDQHSQLQLYLAGPKDKIFTMITLDMKGKGRKISSRFLSDPAINYIKDKTLGDIMAAEHNSILQTLIRHKLPVRTFTLKKLDEAVLGALIMHFTLETIITGRMLGINPFDQPAVEEGKILAKKILEGK